MDINDIKDFFDLNEDTYYQTINDSTSQDLNLDEVFESIDYTHSSIGKQYLYNLLRSVPHTSPIQEYESWIGEYNKDVESKKKVEKYLSKLNHPDAYSICSLIYKDHEILSRKTVILFHVLRFLPLFFLLLFLATYSHITLWFFMGALLVNFGIHFRYKSKSFAYSWSLPQLYKLIVSYEQLSKLPIVKSLNLDSEEPIRRVRKLKSLASSFRFNVKLEMGILSLAWMFVEVVRIFFLFEPITFNSIFVQVRKTKSDLIHIYQTFGLIDTLQSVSQLRNQRTDWSLPTFTNQNILDAKDMIHPLIEDCLANTFTIADKSILILGSNMSGKTSFIRTIGVNVLLSQTIHTCFAKTFSLSKQRIYSGITTKDNLIEGKSYYLSEVLHLKEIIEETQEGSNLILLDELFKGTNTLERVAGASSVLKYLSKNTSNTILVATHDNELIDLCQSNYIPFFFSEKVDNNELVFDYKIEYKVGYNRNAIKILDLYGYPPEIVEEAMHTVEGLKK